MAYLPSGQESPFQKAIAPLLSGSSETLLTSLLSSTALQNINLTKRRQYFVNQTINLDGVRFEECRFDDCVLHTETGDVFLKDCVIGPGTQLTLGPRVVNVAKLLRIFNRHPPLWSPVIKQPSPTVYTVSIP